MHIGPKVNVNYIVFYYIRTFGPPSIIQCIRWTTTHLDETMYKVSRMFKNDKQQGTGGETLEMESEDKL